MFRFFSRIVCIRGHFIRLSYTFPHKFGWVLRVGDFDLHLVFHGGQIMVFCGEKVKENSYRWKGSNLQGSGILFSRSEYFPEVPRPSDCLKVMGPLVPLSGLRTHSTACEQRQGKVTISAPSVNTFLFIFLCCNSLILNDLRTKGGRGRVTH